MLAAQVKMGIFVVIKAYFLPAPVVMAGFALGSIAAFVPLVLVVLAVASDAFFRSTRVFLVGMALFAGNVGMFAADQGKFCLFMIEAGFFPVLRVMAVSAIGAKVAFVHVILDVTDVTFGRRIPIFCLWLMATRTFGRFMFILKNIIRFVMIEPEPVEFRNLRIPSLMLGMAITAFLFLDAPVIALLAADICCHLLVTIETQTGLRTLIEALMAVSALGLILGVSLDHLAG